MIKNNIELGHGSGGRLSQELIEKIFISGFGNEYLSTQDDAANLGLKLNKISFTTDNYIVKPLFFPGGDIGKLAICGTINDLAVNGAIPRFLSCGFIIEEGLEISLLEKIVQSMAFWAQKANVQIVTGDTKVVEKNAADQIFINTAGIGEMIPYPDLTVKNIVEGDHVIITGTIGDHGLTILSQRNDFSLKGSLKSDCAPLNLVLNELLTRFNGIKFMRDPTRGGIASTLNEIIQNIDLGILLEEEKIPVSGPVETVCGMLGLEPYHIANEGKAIIIADSKESEKILHYLKQNEYTQNSEIIGAFSQKYSHKVCVKNRLNVIRILEMLTHDPIPRIC